LQEAYALAGYTPDRGNASRLHQMTAVQGRIDELRATAAARVGLSVERVLNEMIKIAFSNIADFAPVVMGDDARGALEALPPEKTAAILELQTETSVDHGKGPGLPQDVRKVRLKLDDKSKVLVDLGRHLGMFVDKSETTIKGGMPVINITPGRSESPRSGGDEEDRRQRPVGPRSKLPGATNWGLARRRV